MRFTRVTLFFIACIIGLGFYQLSRQFLAEVEPQTYQATEEMMVDTANLLAAQVTTDPLMATALFHKSFRTAHESTFNAKIFELQKRKVGIHVYITDAMGKVIFDSDEGKREGLDYSQMRDVALTMAGFYGARSTRDDEQNPNSSVLYVAAPIGPTDQPTGVLTLYKPQRDVLPLIYKRRRIIYTACALIGGGILFLVAAVFLWLFRPIGKLTEYARAIERGERPAMPRIGIGREVNTLASALESMRHALENRQYVERYLHTLTHELKSPLAGIRGAAELLQEDMPAVERSRFLGNIRAETLRSERLIKRLLELSAIESRTRLEAPPNLDFRHTLSRAVEQARPMADQANVTLVEKTCERPAMVLGDSFILRAAISNLLENAIDFTPVGGSVRLTLTTTRSHATLTIHDDGPGIPDFALQKIYDRFYSYRQPTTGRKGSGLGLTLVKEAAELHNGTITLENSPEGGTIATFTLPLSSS